MNNLIDLEKKIFKHTSSAFVEDPLRVLRFARFKSYSQLHDFSLHSKTINLFHKMNNSQELKELSPERVWMLSLIHI